MATYGRRIVSYRCCCGRLILIALSDLFLFLFLFCDGLVSGFGSPTSGYEI
jgi:hypothetical protein